MVAKDGGEGKGTGSEFIGVCRIGGEVGADAEYCESCEF